MTEQFWKIKSPIGFSALLLDKEMYSELIKPGAKQGLRIEGLPIQVGVMFYGPNQQPSVSSLPYI